MGSAIYPGTFDPVTNGHLDVIERGARLFSRLVVAVAWNAEKKPLFTVEERVATLKELCRSQNNVEVAAFSGLVVEFARRLGVPCLLRGVRTATDFEYELQMAHTNRDLAPEVETVFVMPSLRYSYVSSRLIRESVALGADVSHLIPAQVQERLRERLRDRGAAPPAGDGGPCDVKAQARRVLENLRHVLAAAGTSLERSLRCTVYLADLDDFAAMNEVYAEFFGEVPPARSTIEAKRLPRGARIEIDVIAERG
jgi:pantetheine-phosphate adenylyltransferase